MHTIIYTHTCPQTHTDAYTDIHTHAHTQTRTHSCMQTRALKQAHLCIHTHIQNLQIRTVCIHTDVCAHTHKDTHTHTHPTCSEEHLQTSACTRTYTRTYTGLHGIAGVVCDFCFCVEIQCSSGRELDYVPLAPKALDLGTV